MQSVEKYYDEYTERQVDAGVHYRHKKIQEWLLKFGLQPHHDVLEIGCGIGTQTQLLANFLNKDVNITAIDISPKSIEIAKKNLHAHSHVKLIAGDVVETDLNGKFDVVLLPDVIEHIPLDQHKALFGKIREVLKDDGFVLIHIPNPYYLEWVHVHRKQDLQIIDQPIYTNELCQNIYPHGLHIAYLETYGIWVSGGDYQVVVLRPTLGQERFKATGFPQPSLMGRIVGKLKRMALKWAQS